MTHIPSLTTYLPPKSSLGTFHSSVIFSATHCGPGQSISSTPSFFTFSLKSHTLLPNALGFTQPANSLVLFLYTLFSSRLLVSSSDCLGMFVAGPVYLPMTYLASYWRGPDTSAPLPTHSMLALLSLLILVNTPLPPHLSTPITPLPPIAHRPLKFNPFRHALANFSDSHNSTLSPLLLSLIHSCTR